MKRLFWFGLGIAVGALAVRQVVRVARAYSPAGLAQRVLGGPGPDNSAAGLWGSVQDFSGRAQGWVGDFIADVREGMAAREEQIHAAFARGENLADLGPLAGDDEDFEELLGRSNGRRDYVVEPFGGVDDGADDDGADDDGADDDDADIDGDDVDDRSDEIR